MVWLPHGAHRQMHARISRCGYLLPGWPYWYVKAGRSDSSEVNWNGTVNTFSGGCSVAIADKIMRLLGWATRSPIPFHAV